MQLESHIILNYMLEVRIFILIQMILFTFAITEQPKHVANSSKLKMALHKNCLLIVNKFYAPILYNVVNKLAYAN